MSTKTITPASAKRAPGRKTAPACPLCAKYGEIPNAATAAAIRAVEAGKTTRFSSLNKLFSSLEK